MNHILIEFPVFDGEPMSKPRSAVSCHGGRVRNVAQQTNLPPRETHHDKNPDQLVGGAKAVLDYYRPVVDGFQSKRGNTNFSTCLKRLWLLSYASLLHGARA
jgi:hypothetical protein